MDTDRGRTGTSRPPALAYRRFGVMLEACVQFLTAAHELGQSPMVFGRAVSGMRGILVGIGLTVLAASTGCAGRVVQSRFEREFGCDDTEVTDLGAGAYRVRGCGRTAVYSCISFSAGPHGPAGGGCFQESSSVAPPPSHGPVGQVTARWDEAKGATVVQADIDFAAYHLTLLGAPTVDAARALLVVTLSEGGVFPERCPTFRIYTGSAELSAPLSGEDRTADATTIRYDVPVTALEELPTAGSWNAQFCDEDRSLGYSGRTLLLDFAKKFREVASATGTATPPAVQQAAPPDERTTVGTGRMSADTFQSVLGEHRGSIESCYNNALAATPTLAGDLRFLIIIDVQGAVAVEVEQSPAEFEAAGVTGCIAGILRAMSFAASPPQDGEFRVRLPITFVAPAPAP